MANDEVDRRSAILNAAVECFGTLGYYGTSLQRIATMVNLTKPGVLHYVGSKEGLLHAVLDEMYDRETEDVTAGMVRDERPLIAEMWRRTVAVNAKRPELVHMFSTLSAEALNPDHPAHDYFAEREELAALRERLGEAHRAVGRRLESLGFELFHEPGAGMYLWARHPDLPDSAELSKEATGAGIMLGPGQLFLTESRPTGWLRFNVAFSLDERLWSFLDQSMVRARQAAQ